MPEIAMWNAPGADDSWDYAILGGQFLPGVARVTVKLSSDLDVQKPKGASQATIRDEGAAPADITIELQITEQAELDTLAQMMPILRTMKAGRGPLTIEHPNPNAWGVDKVIIKDIDAPPPDPVDGWTVTISCVEWAPAPVAVKNASKKVSELKPKDEHDGWQAFADKQKGPSKDGSSVPVNTIPEVLIEA